MTTELEQEFFDVFGVEPKWKDKRVKNAKIYYTEEQVEYLRRTTKNRNIQLCYPKITAEKLLEMICILNDYECIDVQGTTIEQLKEELLNQCIEYFKYPIAFEENADLCNLHNKIQQLFKD